MPETKIDDVLAMLRAKIANGEYGTGGRLPTLDQLSLEIGASRPTVNAAVQLLQAEGLMVVKGKSLYVGTPVVKLQGTLTKRFDQHLEQQQKQKATETDIEQPSLVPANAIVAQALQVSEGTMVVRRFRRQGTLSTHYRLTETFYPAELAGGEILEALQKDERYDALLAIKQKHSKIVKKVHEDVTGRFGTKEEQQLLSITRTTPVFELVRLCTTQDDEPVMYNRITLVASYFILSYDYLTSLWDE